MKARTERQFRPQGLNAPEAIERNFYYKKIDHLGRIL